MRIIIVGAGKTGVYLAQRLDHTNDITVVEQRPDHAETLAQLLPDVNVIEGDACEPSVLERAGIGTADVVAAVTGDDEDNLVVAMLAKHFGQAKVYARVNHPRNEWLFDEDWGVDVAISAPTLLAESIKLEG